MKILSIKYLETCMPNCGSGTGYSEPDKFHIICDENLYANNIWHPDSNEKDVWIDTWCLSDSSIKRKFIKTIKEEIGDIDNIDEAFEMYKESIKKK